MKNTRTKRGRPAKAAETRKTAYLDLRLSLDEKTAFQEAADLAGISISAWARERLRAVAIRELESAGRMPAFIKSIPLGGPRE